MSRKRRVFDIEMPGEEASPAGPRIRTLGADPGDPRPRRGPMASAIAENADAVAARRESEAAIRAENDALAHEFVALREAGLVARLLPLDDVVAEALIRDRAPGPDPELPELVASIRDTGLSNPIRVEEREDGRFELVQGWRRLAAYRTLRDETGEERWASIPAGILPRGEGLAATYRRMIDENLIRRDLSFAEMADVARRFAAEPGSGVRDVGEAVAVLFASAGYQKRSYIRAFAQLLDAIGADLAHPQAIPRSLGLTLKSRIDESPSLGAGIRAALTTVPERSAEEELQILRIAADPERPATPGRAAAKAGQGARRPRINFGVTRGGLAVRCTAGEGRLEIRADLDFSTLDRRRLEAAVAELIETLL
jgi:ParB family chromosome partitioning protein